MSKRRWYFFASILLLAVLCPVGTAFAQITMLESTVWAPSPTEGPAPMGAFDEQQVPLFDGPNPPAAGGCDPVVPPAASPAGVCGPTLWHTEIDCCAVGGVFGLPMTSPVAAYNQGDLMPPIFDYVTLDPAGLSIQNSGAISSVGLRGVPLKPTPVAAAPQIVLSFDTVKDTEGGGTGTFDECFVETRVSVCGENPCLDPAGVGWLGFVKITGNHGCAAPLTCTIGPGNPVLDASFIGADGKVRFRFDTLDGVSNTYCGWMVDNVRITNEKCDPPCGPGSPFQPQIGSMGGMPRPGNLGFTLTLSAAPPGSPTLLVLGLQKQFLPLPGLGLPSPGCTLCCDPMFVFATPPTNAAGNTMVPIPIPPGIAPCATICAQWAVIALGPAGPLILTSSKGDIGIQP